MLVLLSKGCYQAIRDQVCVSKLLLIDLPDIPDFDSLICLKLCNFFLVFSWQHLRLCFLLFIQYQVSFVFIFSDQLFQVFVEILSLSFYLVNFECGANLAVDHSLVYCSYLKFFLLFFSLTYSLIPVLKSSSQFIAWFCFGFLSQDLLKFCDQLSPVCKLSLSSFNCQ